MPLCIITGVGPENGTGAEIAKYFSEKKYKVAMIARNKENLRKLENKYDNSQAYPCDVGNLKTFTKTLNLINEFKIKDILKAVNSISKMILE